MTDWTKRQKDDLLKRAAKRSKPIMSAPKKDFKSTLAKLKPQETLKEKVVRLTKVLKRLDAECEKLQKSEYEFRFPTWSKKREREGLPQVKKDLPFAELMHAQALEKADNYLELLDRILHFVRLGDLDDPKIIIPKFIKNRHAHNKEKKRKDALVAEQKLKAKERKDAAE
jgi:hypothetical protein